MQWCPSCTTKNTVQRLAQVGLSCEMFKATAVPGTVNLVPRKRGDPGNEAAGFFFFFCNFAFQKMIKKTRPGCSKPD